MPKSDFTTALERPQAPKNTQVRPIDRKPLLVKLPPDQVKEVKRLALELDTTIQELMSEAVSMMLTRYGGR